MTRALGPSSELTRAMLDRLLQAGADVVSTPLGAHPAVIRLACRRRRHAELAAALTAGQADSSARR